METIIHQPLKFKSLPHLLDHFKDEKTCIEYYERLRWNGLPECPHCAAKHPYRTKDGFKCSNSECYKKFTVKIGTVFEGSNLKFRTWFAAIYLFTSSKKGVSSVLLAEQLGITQKSAWFMLHRLREMMLNQVPKSFDGSKIVEIDETHVGGLEENRHKNKKRYQDTDLANDGTLYNKKKVVIGMVERGGLIALKSVSGYTSNDLLPVINDYVPKGSQVMTDESLSYFKLKHTHIHSTVNHSARVFKDGNTHTNTIENFFSIFKRGINGIYHQVSEKHLDRYLNEFASRYNYRNISSFARFELFLSKANGGILYKNLVSENGKESGKEKGSKKA